VNHVTLPIDIASPSLWYPAGYGAQPIYKFQAQLKVGKQLLDEVTAKTGLRSIVLRREPDQWGRSFEFIVNGIPVFGKGADVIPFDSFPTRVTTQQYRQALQSAVDANMNMVRHWGGGYYETDEFYDICDELGIMIWQDFMFGNDWQPGTYDWKLNVAMEAEQQLRRLRNHPSIILWCGNNETEVALAWKDAIAEVNAALKKIVAGKPDQVVAVLSPFLTCEEAYLLAHYFKGLSPRTMASRRTRLTSEETEKTLRAKYLFEQAVGVFGSEEEARRWLTNPAYGLEDQRPIDLLDTEPGAMQVRDYLGAIECGNYW